MKHFVSLLVLGMFIANAYLRSSRPCFTWMSSHALKHAETKMHVREIKF